ncbi:unnamed protein product [Brachionus calyciflorus]|uniref:Cadherin domain-containing protein n=1 Tax=Brachionus calyciflorus TaxID=104777 RepID=A0A813ZAH7_9BILA|nr:unnamed protein product [Brachionus calyciflorus]
MGGVSFSDNSTSFKLDAYSPDANTVLQYSILREERTTFDGTYENITEETNKFYKIRPNDGLIQLNRVEKLTDYSSILLFIRVQDTTLHSSPTECLVDFKFCNLNSKIARFIGFGLRYENICEDLPVNSLIMSLKAFDPSHSNQKLCYTLAQNDYFSLKTSEPNENGDVYLKKKINLKELKNLNGNSYLNFTAFLSFCNNLHVLNKQMININVLNVNKYPPKLALKSSTVSISLSVLGNNSIPSFDVTDEDISPFDYFKCNIENNDNFALLNNNDVRKVYLTYKNLLVQEYPSKLYADLVIRCCDDSKYWTENSCHSVPKCSLNLLRVEFKETLEQVYCLNDEQFNYLDINTQYLSEITSVKCASNYTDADMSYQLLTQSNYFGLNPSNGSIYLKNFLFNETTEQLKILCTNRKTTAICKLNIIVVAPSISRPIWIFPNPSNFQNCISVYEDAPKGSFVIKVSSMLPNSDLLISYSFVDDGKLVDSIYEFTFNDSNSGNIYLINNLNRSQSIQRELTLAASVLRPNDITSITTYQYICFNILPSLNYQPCFRTLPNNQKWPYLIEIIQTKTNCFYDQMASISNKDSLTPKVYYYLIGSGDLIDRVFDLDQSSGLLCINSSFTRQNVVDLITKSAQGYIDEFDNLSYNLNIVATKREIKSKDELASLQYDKNNCSFNYFKIISGKRVVQNITKVKFKEYNYFSLIHLDKITQMDLTCLFKFEFENLKLSNNFYNYEIKPINNPFDSSIFYINSSNDCLALKLESGINKLSYLNRHEFKVNAIDELGNLDTAHVKVYIVQGCLQKGLVLSSIDKPQVEKNFQKYVTFFNEILTLELKSKMEIFVSQVYDLSNLKDKHQDNKFYSTNSLLELAVYDITADKFIPNRQFIGPINTNAKSSTSKDLGIIEAVSSCPTLIQDSIVGRAVAIGLVSFFIGLLMLIVPLFLVCFTCRLFKKLKYKDNRVILKDRVIPIVRNSEIDTYPSFISSDCCIKPVGYPLSDNIEQEMIDDSGNSIFTFLPNKSDQILSPNYEVKSFKPTSSMISFPSNQEISIRVRENRRAVRDEEIQMGDLPKRKNNIEEIREVGTVTLSQNNYEYYDQKDIVINGSKENLI